MQEYAKHFARCMLSTLLGQVSAVKYIILYPETGPREKVKVLKKSLRGGKLLIKTLQIFCMNNKAIIEFRFITHVNCK